MRAGLVYTQEVILDEAQLVERCEYWQQRLRLQDWIIKTRIVRGHVIDGVNGRVSYNLKSKHALISLADPIDYNPQYMVPLDMEYNLVHELMHLHFAPFCPDESDAEEAAIEAIVYGLIGLERERGQTHGGGND